MALEDRVRALEDEIAILKGQIHSTLLEIQEQILFHYYPDLRAKDSASSDTAAPALRGHGAPAAASFAGVQRISLDEPEPAPGEEQAPLSVASLVRADAKRSLTDAAPEPEDPGQAAEEQAIAPAAAQSTDWSVVARLTDWAGDSIQQIGKERTTRAIEIYAQGGYIDLGARDALLQLIELSNEPSSVERVSLKSVLDVLLKLNGTLGREADIATTRRMMEEVQVG